MVEQAFRGKVTMALMGMVTAVLVAVAVVHLLVVLSAGAAQV
jgi:hypothetical protein